MEKKKKQNEKFHHVFTIAHFQTTAPPTPVAFVVRSHTSTSSPIKWMKTICQCKKNTENQKRKNLLLVHCYAVTTVVTHSLPRPRSQRLHQFKFPQSSKFIKNENNRKNRRITFWRRDRVWESKRLNSVFVGVAVSFIVELVSAFFHRRPLHPFEGRLFSPWTFVFAWAIAYTTAQPQKNSKPYKSKQEISECNDGA